MGIRTAGMHRHRTWGYKECIRQGDRWAEALSVSDMSLGACLVLWNLGYPGGCSGGLLPSPLRSNPSSSDSLGRNFCVQSPFTCCWCCLPVPTILRLELGFGCSTLQWAGQDTSSELQASYVPQRGQHHPPQRCSEN